MCEQSLPVAKRSHGIAVNEQHQDNFSSCANQNRENLHLKQWRWRLSAKCLYYLGKLDEAIDLLKKHESSVPSNAVDKYLTLFMFHTHQINSFMILRALTMANLLMTCCPYWQGCRFVFFVDIYGLYTGLESSQGFPVVDFVK